MCEGLAEGVHNSMVPFIHSHTNFHGYIDSTYKKNARFIYIHAICTFITASLLMKSKVKHFHGSQCISLCFIEILRAPPVIFRLICSISDRQHTEAETRWPSSCRWHF